MSRDKRCERCSEIVLLIETSAAIVALAPTHGRERIGARERLHFAADELAAHYQREHTVKVGDRTSERPPGE